MPRPHLELAPREVLGFVEPLPDRQQPVYLVACHGLCQRVRGDREIGRRISALTEKYRRELAAVLLEARQLEAELTATMERGRGRSIQPSCAAPSFIAAAVDHESRQTPR